MSTRRHLLRAGLGALALGSGWRALAAPQTDQRLLVVFLRGAYDAANTLVPLQSSFYQEVRPSIAIAPPGQGPGSAERLSTDWGLHPALAPHLMPLWRAGQLAFVPFSGLDDPSRSHFEMQDKIETGWPGAPRGAPASGFLNRLATELDANAPSRAVAFTATLPPVFQGPRRVPNVSLAASSRTPIAPDQTQRILRMYEGTELAPAVNEGFATRSTVSRELAYEMEAASRGAMSSKGFQAVARRIARLMNDEYRLAFVDIGGWDTHVAEGGATGHLANLLAPLGEGLALLARDMAPVWKQTSVVVVSEFGRTFRENGNHGTDHGHGSALWVLGGSVRGAQVAGEQIALRPGSLHEDRDWPVLNDYRAVLGGLLARQYGLSAAAVGRVFPGIGPADLRLL